MSKQLIFNNKFIPLYDNHDRYLLTFGGAGSGKSVFCAQKILSRILNEPNHRFLVCRKVAKTIRHSVFRLFQQLISELDMYADFIINKSDKTFLHKPSGNEIICSGLDDPEKLKSIAGITSIWIEEATEMEENDFDQLDIRLRGITPNYKQILVSFNPIDENHWIKKRFVDAPPDNCTIHHSTFLDNQFIDPEYKKVLESKSETNPNYYRIYYRGEWGLPEVQRPFMYNFDSEKHISKKLCFNPNEPLRFSFDFNIDPFVCIIGQVFRDIEGHHIHLLDEIELKNGDVYKMAETISTKYGKHLLSNAFFTGDAMQQKREISQRSNSTAWEILIKELNISPARIHLTKSNPLVMNSGMQCNALLSRHPDLKFNQSMKNTINDMRMVESTPEGAIIKANRNNSNQRSDFLDAFRYFINTWCGELKY